MPLEVREGDDGSRPAQSCCEPPDMGSEEKTLGVLWKSSKHSSVLSSPPAPSYTLVSLNYRQNYNTRHIIRVVEIL